MSRLVLVIAGLVLSVSAAAAATGTLLQQAQAAAPVSTTVSAAEEPISLNAALIAAGILVAGFLSFRRRAD
jgi:hypothetical protein